MFYYIYQTVFVFNTGNLNVLFSHSLKYQLHNIVTNIILKKLIFPHVPDN